MTEGARVYPLQKRQQPEPLPVEPLWREVLGRRLRALRGLRGETLAETAERAGISPQYLSEVERGLKEPSSEMIAALAGALGSTLADLTTGVAEELQAFQVIGDRASRLDRVSRLDRASRPEDRAAGLNQQTSRSPAGPVALALAS
ncbi:MAG: helix-turn-helix transcriptional regulator [Nocardiopsaceae bacterium]|nr:helix-turn-helix transcriptional regulator [Nocardiopsaceae bacterium]